ncbi:L,D-transpeptidase [Clostridium sp. BJN0001]|uniref:L,D-transpeptidase n=1 Tax=Clostridium sp. BJN0001 TaxID=2930219 RepID=UPI001FD16CC9|nr:L,D-transpeptidase [Clostridium sp. BJN0001]
MKLNKTHKHFINLFLIFFITFSFFNYKSFISYKLFLEEFKTAYNNRNLSYANSILMHNDNFNPYKKLFLDKDLNNFFNRKVLQVFYEINEDKISDDEALGHLYELCNYTYSKSTVKKILLNHISLLVKKDYYSIALNTLDKMSILFPNDSEIENSKSTIETTKDDYLAKSCLNNINSISDSNINSSYIESNTDYLIFVDTDLQKTYIYEGDKNNWNKLKTFSCSTGTKQNKTPEGIFSIQQKGNWFFSKKYNEGAKYWSQINGNILFHSYPFSKDKETIIDSTLGTPLSHGCIRLSTDNSKWIFKNIPKDTKVIIN